jgi:hypothetical protein
MDSDFMRKCGGPQQATKLVYNAWKSPFLNTVLNIVLDAWGKGVDILCAKSADYMYGGVHGNRFDAAGLLKHLRKTEPAVLSKTYWLCIFAVNEHLNICGDCFNCRLRDGAPKWTSSDYAANPCIGCGNEKFNPCPCGSLKTLRGEPEYEIDKFDEVV